MFASLASTRLLSAALALTFLEPVPRFIEAIRLQAYDTLLQMAQVSNIVGVKDSTGDFQANCASRRLTVSPANGGLSTLVAA